MNDKKIYTWDIKGVYGKEKNKINPKELHSFEMAGHFSEHGYKVVSEIIYRNLIEEREN